MNARIFSAIVAMNVALFGVAGAAPKSPPDPHEGATMPVREQNVDSQGYIAVHEQGTAKVDVQNSELDVNITNSTLDVSGSTVSVDDFPATQDVYVTDGIVDTVIPPATAVRRPSFSLDAGESGTYDFATINATTIVMWDNSVTGDNDPEFQLWVRSPLTGGGGMFKYAYEDGLQNLDMRSFTHPIPVSGVEIWCKNESLACILGVSIIGYDP